MKNGVAIFVMCIFISCNSNKDSEMTPASEDSFSLADNPQFNISSNTTDALWGYEYDTSTRKYAPVKMKEFRRDTLTVTSILNIVNATWPDIQANYVRTGGDTLYLQIPESKMLTQGMGTSGANEYIASTTFSFTELPQINYVAYDFKDGDHAGAGVYSRKMWEDQ